MAEPTIQLGGGNWAGKSDNLLGYYKEGERFYKQDFTFSRSTTGTYTDSDGYIQEMPYNEVTYSEQFDLWAISGSITRTSNIATAPNGTLTADGIQDTSGGSYKRVRKSISVNPNSTYTSSCYIKKVTSETAYTGFGLVFSGGTQKLAYGIIDSVNGTITSASSTITPTFNVVSVGEYWRFEMTATDNGSNSSLEFSIYATLSTNGTSLNVGIGSIRTLWGAQLVKGTSAKTYFPTTTRLNMPRVDYLNNSNGSLILEPQRSNLVTYSSDFSQSAWNKENVTITANDTTSPDGTENADTVIDSATNTRHISYLSFSGNLATERTLSVYAKQNTLRYLFLSVTNSGDSNCYSAIFDLQSGVVSATKVNGSATNSASIQSMGNGWYRCIISGTMTTGTTTFFPLIGTSDRGGFTGSLQNNNAPIYTGSGQSIYIWGAQLEAGSYATTLINTSGSSVTRNADACSITNVADRINSSEGVLYAEISALNDDLTNRAISLSDGTINNGIQIEYFNVSNRIRFRVYAGGVLRATIQAIGITITNTNKLALKWESGFMTVYINGAIVGTAEAIAATPTGLDRLKFDLGQGSSKFIGKAKQIQVYNTALSNSELATLTT